MDMLKEFKLKNGFFVGILDYSQYRSGERFYEVRVELDSNFYYADIVKKRHGFKRIIKVIKRGQRKVVERKYFHKDGK